MTDNKKDDAPRLVRISTPSKDGIPRDTDFVWASLPPIANVVVPKTTTKSAIIRWYHALGYTPSEIYRYMGVKYQMVRNIITTTPKRAAREDLPSLVVELREEGDLVSAAIDGSLDASLLAARKERLADQNGDQ